MQWEEGTSRPRNIWYFGTVGEAPHDYSPNAALNCTTNPLTPELNPSAQRCLTRFFTVDFASSTVHFVNICVKNQQMQQLFIQFINFVW
jgi:hypothetical protein